MSILPLFQFKSLLVKIGNVIFKCITYIISFFLLRKNEKAYNIKPLVSFGSIIAFIVINVIMPDWQGFWRTKDLVGDDTSHAVTLSRVCKEFENASDAMKITLGYKDKVRSLVQGWWSTNNTLLSTTDDQFQAARYGSDIYLAVNNFRTWNSEQIYYVLRNDTCSPDMSSIDKIVDKRDDIFNKLPLTVGGYIRFYIEVRLLGKGVKFTPTLPKN